ncbi:ML domain-containing protein [Amylostereum chailletii]|nr:ML domain-containing protein [Amylostereum chailletii]
MARFSLAAFFALTLLSISHATPLSDQVALSAEDQPVRTTEGWGWDNCGSASDDIQIDSIEVSPSPPKPGEEMTVTVKASALKTVEEGAYADVVVKLGLIKLLHKEFNLCEEARNANASVSCPVEKGDYTVVQTVTLPKEIPQAKFKVAAKGYTSDDEDLFCVDITVDFMKKPFFKLPSIGW